MKKVTKKPIDFFKAAKTTGDLVKAFRANFNIKQDDMAHACKISQANFSAIEKNRREVGPRVALKLAATGIKERNRSRTSLYSGSASYPFG